MSTQILWRPCTRGLFPGCLPFVAGHFKPLIFANRCHSSGEHIVPILGTCYLAGMRLIARSTVVKFYLTHPETRMALERWLTVLETAVWTNMADVQNTFPKAKVLNRERVRFEIQGGDYRLIASFKFGSQICFVEFIGTHAAYDRVDALTISQF